jgi:VanZ family protein
MTQTSSLPAKLIDWLPVLLWCAIIFALSHQPNLRITEGDWDFALRKTAHIVEYGILALLTWRAFARTTAWSAKQVLGWTLTFCIAYAASDEFHQNFVVGRHGSWVDVAIDTVGIIIASVYNYRKALSSWTSRSSLPSQ